jgi:hypothetical protein
VNVIEIRDIENNQSKYSIIWFVLEEYPDSVFGLKHFPNAEFKKDYIIHDNNTNYFDQVEILKVLESNIAAIKAGLVKIMDNYPQFQLRLLFSSDILQ